MTIKLNDFYKPRASKPGMRGDVGVEAGIKKLESRGKTLTIAGAIHPKKLFKPQILTLFRSKTG
jgi:hypothetical protein